MPTPCHVGRPCESVSSIHRFSTRFAGTHAFEESLASIDARIEQLRARRRDEVARHERSERRARSAACMALGEAVAGWYGDWRRLDPAKFAVMLGRLSGHRAALAAPAGRTDAETAAAYRALRRGVAEAEEQPDGADMGNRGGGDGDGM